MSAGSSGGNARGVPATLLQDAQSALCSSEKIAPPPLQVGELPFDLLDGQDAPDVAALAVPPLGVLGQDRCTCKGARNKSLIKNGGFFQF